MIEIELPYPPCLNHYKMPGRLVKTRTGKVYQSRINTPETTRYYFAVSSIIFRMRRSEGLKCFGDATIGMEVYAYPPDKRKRDLDGILKVLLDAMQKAGLYNDDYNIARLYVERKDIIPSGKVIVRIREL